ncbi:dipeptidase [Solibacillus sp. MA9]|uniref:Dipeptidase n=1 Tax=Solibacillus palustris TaxID=2908203 RepID=A0ABS9U7S2_9BACL|nr:membrane dipeptidase [Solibacillus sp. MA9]MCH7320382.1 dipeptidase [Solibacillus sp. MA9]
MAIPIIDLHCDALLRLFQRNDSFTNAPALDVNYEKLQAGNVMAQAFAIYVNPDLSPLGKIQSAYQQAEYFQQLIEAHPKMVHMKQWHDFHTLQPGQIGAFLTIEGVDFFGGNIKFWHEFYKFGVLAIGLTWNFANEAADGLYSKLGRGVTDFGREIIQLNNTHKIFTDVTHLHEQSFWHVLEHADYVIASHSNATSVCNHERNLTDEQIRAMITKNAPMHVVYFPEFVNGTEQADMSELIKHIDHISSLGGKHLIGLGSDFDGISSKIPGLEHAGMHQNLVNELLKYYREDDVRGFCYENFLNHLPK